MDITALLHSQAPTGTRADASAGRRAPDSDFTAVLEAAGRSEAASGIKGLARLTPAQAPILLNTPVDADAAWQAHAAGTDLPATRDGKADASDTGGTDSDEDKGTAQTSEAAQHMQTPPAMPAAPVDATGVVRAAETGDQDPALRAAGRRSHSLPAHTDAATRRDHATRADDKPARLDPRAAPAAAANTPDPATATSVRTASAAMAALAGRAPDSKHGTALPSVPSGTDAGPSPLLAGHHPAGTATTASNPVPAATPAPTLQAPLGSAAWQQALGQQLIRLGRHGDHQVKLQLHPAELGTLQVNLHFNHDSAQAQFLTAHAQARDAVQQAIPQLREAFAQHGIALGEANVGQQNNPQDQRGDMHRDAFDHASAGDVGAVEGHPPEPGRPMVRTLHASGVDLYA